MEHTWRWFGPDDPINLAEIRQTGARGVVTALHHIPNGEVWPVDEIERRRAEIEAAGLRWAVVESVPVHEHIKWGGPDRARAIANYAATIRNLAHAGLNVVCYNFMPVLDWTRTELWRPSPTGGQALAFDFDAYAAFDLFVLRREDAGSDYSPREVESAREAFDAMSAADIDVLTRTILAGLPGSEESYDLDDFRVALARYSGVTHADLRQALLGFLDEVLPVAEANGVRLAIHPDDPPRSLFGLPRILSTGDDVRALLDARPSPSNGLTLCVGSFASEPANDPVELARRFASRISFVHLRNVRVGADGKSFVESDHLDGDVDMVGVITALGDEEQRRERDGAAQPQIPMRPDHGHVLLDDSTRSFRPGYPLIGRMKGLSQLAGVEAAVTWQRARVTR